MGFPSLISHVQAFAASSPAIFGIIVFSGIIAFTRWIVLIRLRKLTFPVVGRVCSFEMKNDLIEGARLYPEEPFTLPTIPPTVILPECVLDEIRNLPEEHVSFMQVVRNDFNYRYTTLGQNRPEVIQAVKVDLTRNIASVLDCLQDEVKYSLSREIGNCPEWTSKVLYQKVLRIIALMSGRVFVGLPLSREEEWLRSTINFTTDAVAASDAVRGWNYWLRPFVAPFLKEIRRVKKYKVRGGELLAPYMQQKLQDIQNKTKKQSVVEEQSAFIGWVLKHTKEEEKFDPAVMGLNQMVLSFAAIHTTGMGLTHAILDLATRPEYVQPLRDEIEEIIKQEGYDLMGDGSKKLKKSSLPRLRKLDSFLKESQRMSPPGLFVSARQVMKPLTLSTGHVLPVGTKFAFNSWATHMSTTSQTFSPEYNPPSSKLPEVFDGYRFYNLRAMKGKENKHQYVSTAPDSLSFGHGSHACPGRFFASNEIKIILVELLRKYDVRLKGDVEGKGGEDKRPMDFMSQAAIYPNPLAELEFRNRAVVDEKPVV